MVTTTTSPREVLIAAKALITSPDKWTQRVFARDMLDRKVPPIDPEACKFCALGAIYAASSKLVPSSSAYGVPEKEGRTAMNILQHTARNRLGMSASEVNDTYSHQIVMKLFDTAIEKATESE